MADTKADEMAGPPVDPRRSALMSRVRAKDTLPELIVRRTLHRLGFRFRLHDKRLPGSPDIVMRSRRVAIFVHGCFWHRHPRCRAASSPSIRREFWEAKFASNVKRDFDCHSRLEADGWAVHVVWECETKRTPTFLDSLVAFLASHPKLKKPGSPHARG
jgi:DNA mismatch endonuclease (patch repair protein)